MSRGPRAAALGLGGYEMETLSLGLPFMAAFLDPEALVLAGGMLNPLGYGLEIFDAVGARRDSDRGQPIDASGVLSSGERFSDTEELLALPQVVRELVEAQQRTEQRLERLETALVGKAAHAERLRQLLRLNLKSYVPRITAAHRDAISGPIPTTGDERSLREFSDVFESEFLPVINFLVDRSIASTRRSSSCATSASRSSRRSSRRTRRSSNRKERPALALSPGPISGCRCCLLDSVEVY